MKSISTCRVSSCSVSAISEETLPTIFQPIGCLRKDFAFPVQRRRLVNFSSFSLMVPMVWWFSTISAVSTVTIVGPKDQKPTGSFVTSLLGPWLLSHRFPHTILSEYPSFPYALVHHSLLFDINIKAFQQNCYSAELFKIKWIFSLWNRIDKTVGCLKTG